MDYYRKLIRSKAYDESEPDMPGKKKAYHSIFSKKISPATERKQNNIRDRRTLGPDDRDESAGWCLYHPSGQQRAQGDHQVIYDQFYKKPAKVTFCRFFVVTLHATL